MHKKKRDTSEERETRGKLRRMGKSYMKDVGLHQIKNAKAHMEAYHNKHALMEFRKKLLDDQKKHNYNTEYDRIRGLLASSTQPGRTMEQLQNRAAELKQLGAKALNIN